MTYEELRDYALKCSLEHHLCNVDDLIETGDTIEEILTMVEENNKSVIVWDAYEYYEPSSLAEAIEDARGVKVHEFMEVLTLVNGTEWATNFKEGK
jgi:hypoxanthine phosphoribosyltransferase